MNLCFSVRRALERFNCQMQHSMMTMSQHQQQPPPAPVPTMNYMSSQYPAGYARQGSYDPFYSGEPNQVEAWTNSYHSMPRPSNPNGNSSGYQSIIGRRRQMRHDETYFDNTSVGNGYSSSLFLNSQNPYAMVNPYMNLSDEPPIVPPRFSRENYLDQREYLSENVNNNNNSNHPLHQYGGTPGAAAYPPPTNGFRSIHNPYPPSDVYHPFQEEDYLRHRAQSTSSTTSSESVHPIRLVHQRLPPTMARTHPPQKNGFTSEQGQLSSGKRFLLFCSPMRKNRSILGQPASNYTNATGDSVFHRLAYTGTKASLSKSSSNLCANLLNKTTSVPLTQTNTLKTQEIDLDDTNNQSLIDANPESTSPPTNNLSKCQRSRSVDGRARLKNAQARMANGPPRPGNEYDEQHSPAVPSSKFTSAPTRRETQPPRLPITPRSMMNERNSVAKRTPSGNNLNYMRHSPAVRTRASNGNLLDSDHALEHDDSSSINDHYQPKIIETRPRTGIPVHRHATTIGNGNYLQPSASTSSVSSTLSRTRLPISTSAHLEGKDSNASCSELNR